MLFRKNSYRLRDIICDHFHEYAFSYLLFVCFALFGITTGFLRGYALRASITIEIIRIDYIKNFVKGRTAISSFFSSHILSNLIFILAISALSFFIYTLPISFVATFYRAYLFGLNFFFLTRLAGGGASIMLWTIIFPLELIMLFLLCSYSVLSFSRCICCHKYGYRQRGAYLWLLKQAWVFFTIFLFIALLEFLLLNFFYKSFIIIF